MRQVPNYLLIGNGRVARHFQHYFSLLKLSFNTWHRHQSLSQLHQHVEASTHILLLINDSAIDELIDKHFQQTPALRIHFSGSLISHHAFGAHPLMTFGDHLYDLKQYQHIPFVLEEDTPAFASLLPGLPNHAVRLPKALKAKYHALCVLSGNFSCLLWQKLFASFEREFKLPSSIAYPYLRQQTQNLLNDNHSALTGPLVRDDQATIEKNLSALQADPFQEVYQSFVSCYAKSKKEEVL